MLKKELILPQSSLLIPSRLTIGYDFFNSWFWWDHYGFIGAIPEGNYPPFMYSECIGTLEPAIGYDYLIVSWYNKSNPDLYDVHSSRPFLYNGKLYDPSSTTVEEAAALWKEWKSLDGKTVDVYLSPA